MSAPRGHPAYEGGGRPPRYSKEEIEAFADELLIWLKDPSNLWLKDFCLNLDIDPDYMSEWASENPKFRGAYRLAKSRQESRLVNGGLNNKLNATIVKFALTNIHDWERENRNVDSEVLKAYQSVMTLLSEKQKHPENQSRIDS